MHRTWMMVMLLGVVCASRAFADCDCGPDFCLDDSRYAGLLKAKKSKMTADGYPADLIALLDKDGACVARVERSPDIFSIKEINADGSTNTFAWNADDEARVQGNVLNGQTKAYYKFNVSRAFKCCGQPAHDARPDWNAADSVNTSLAIKCEKSGLNVVCK